MALIAMGWKPRLPMSYGLFHHRYQSSSYDEISSSWPINSTAGSNGFVLSSCHDVPNETQVSVYSRHWLEAVSASQWLSDLYLMHGLPYRLICSIQQQICKSKYHLLRLKLHQFENQGVDTVAFSYTLGTNAVSHAFWNPIYQDSRLSDLSALKYASVFKMLRFQLYIYTPERNIHDTWTVQACNALKSEVWTAFDSHEIVNCQPVFSRQSDDESAHG